MSAVFAFVRVARLVEALGLASSLDRRGGRKGEEESSRMRHELFVEKDRGHDLCYAHRDSPRVWLGGCISLL